MDFGIAVELEFRELESSCQLQLQLKIKCASSSLTANFKKIRDHGICYKKKYLKVDLSVSELITNGIGGL